jgi:ElaB/YqjD/DUF883 family membrane-anchored ribosome-binding protein
MSQPFDITVTNPKLSLDANGHGETLFTVTNSSSETRQVALKLATINPQHKNWLKMEGELEREFPKGGTHQYPVKIEVPADKFKGRFDFRLEVYSAVEAKEKLTQGPSVTVEMKPVVKPIANKPPKKGFPWLVAIVVILVLSNIGSVVALWQLYSEITKNHQELSTLKDIINTAKSKAGQAQEQADTAVSKVDQALGTANTALSKTNQAMGTANNALSQTEKALKTANIAASKANKALQGIERYTNNNNGSVTDKRTGLIWLKNANCFGKRNWKDANRLAKQLKSGKCGLSDGSKAGNWRLPSKEEWQVMANRQYRRPTLSNATGTGKWSEGNAFSSVISKGYWSSTPDDSKSAWVMSLVDGSIQAKAKSTKHYVWFVRLMISDQLSVISAQ